MELKVFEGRWRVDRSIDDRRAGQHVRFEGEARFVARDGGLDYEETGRMLMPGVAPMTSSRRYRWEPDGEGIRVFFEDGRFFHRFDVKGSRPAADHWCDPDDYRVTYDFSEWPVWRSRWSVNGPRKEYVSESRYRRP